MEVESKLWRYAAGVQTLPYGARELGRRAVGVRDVEVWSSGALEARCRRAGMEAWSYEGSLQV